MERSRTGLHLAVDDLARRFGRRWAVARVTFEVEAGGGLLITGANGSGKTTLLRCLATALKPHHGAIFLGGDDLWRHRSRLRPLIGLLSHAGRFYDDLSARDNLRVWARLGNYDIDVKGLLEQVALPTDRREPVRTFSAGMRKRLALAIALIKQPRLMLLDEPFAALDPIGRQLMGEVVQGLRDAGTTVVLASHLPAEAAPYCTGALHLDAGRIVWRGEPGAAAVHGGHA